MSSVSALGRLGRRFLRTGEGEASRGSLPSVRLRRIFRLARLPLSTAALTVLVSIFAASAQIQELHVGGPVEPVAHMYGAFWEVGGGRNSTLVLRNNDPHNVATIQATLFGNTGQPVGVAQIRVAASSVSRVDLSTIAGTEGGWGGLRLEFVAAVPQIAGKVVIADSPSGSSVELPLQGGYRYDTENALYAPWWLPDAVTEGRITIFNSSPQILVVSPSLAVKGAEQAGGRLTLGPYETKQLRLRDLLSESNEISGAVVLRYLGPPHALQPALLLENKSTGFSLASTFNAKHSQATDRATTWQFPDVLFGSAAPSSQDQNIVPVETYALLSNGTTSRLSPQLIAYYGVRGRATKTEIPVVSLAPLETRLIDLSRTGLIPTSVSHFALSAAHSGVPGDLGIDVFSVSKTSDFVFKSIGAVLPGGAVDSSYWNTATDVCLLPKVKNVSSVSADGQVAAYYQTSFGIGSYLLPVLTVPGGKSKTLALKQDLQSGIPDQNGAIVPGGTTSGILTLAVVSGSGNDPSVLADSAAAECKTAGTCAPAPAGSLGVAGDAATPAALHLVVPDLCTPPPTAPVITSISPTGAPFGTDTQVTITGEYLNDPGITVNIAGGIKATIQSATSTQLVATFDTSGESTVGAQDLYLSSDDGYSNEKNFQVGDPTPSITSVTPAVWLAGQNTPVTITGTGFGSQTGTVTLDDSSLIWTPGTWTDTGVSGGAKITGTVSVPASTPLEYPTVTVTSKGYSGSGFVASTPGQSPTSPTYTVQVQPIPTISGPTTVWWFSGQNPSGYSTSITLTSSGGASTTWAVTSGATKVKLSATSGASTNVTSSGTAFSSAVGDIKITATVAGVTSSPFAITSREPYRLVAGIITKECDPTYGYSDHLNYQIQDQLLVNLSSDVPIGEKWTAPAVQDYAGNNWGWPTAKSTTAAAGAFSDHITGRAITGAIPVPVCTGSSVKVQHRNQSWYAGSLTIGVGTLVQTDVLGRFRDHADHESIVSPVP